MGRKSTGKRFNLFYRIQKSILMKPVKILLVDDDNIFVFLTKRIIESTDLATEVSVYTNGQDAINYVKASKGDADALPDILFLDLSMPIMDGWDFLEEYHAFE